MSDIKVGDLVIVVKPRICCGEPTALGAVFKVTSFRLSSGHCKYCKTRIIGATQAVGWNKPIRIERLRRIDPLSDPEAIEREMETM